MSLEPESIREHPQESKYSKKINKLRAKVRREQRVSEKTATKEPQDNWRKPCFVYLAEVEGLIKIGAASSVPDRLNSLTTKLQRPARFIWARKYQDNRTAHSVEAVAQYLLWQKRISGEWFRTSEWLATRALYHADDFVHTNPVARSRFPKLLSALDARDDLSKSIYRFKQALKAARITNALERRQA